MELNFIELLTKNWALISQAPGPIALLLVSMSGLAYVVARWQYTSIIEQLKVQNETLKERLLLRSEQVEQYKISATKHHDNLKAIVGSDTNTLSEKTLSLVFRIRKFINRYRIEDNELREKEFQELAKASDEAERTSLWDKFTSAESRLSNERNAEWAESFKVDTLMLRDELRSRLKDYVPDQKYVHMYEHPTNNFGFSAVADDLERMAKLLPGSS
jgi:hypothetical protein